ncbi:Bug family tripartite tricarboxylate transporter substrate binding protein [Muricoccus radiodurans]|uniref:Bug family tripartite tricarboxylate transporter substrate binding protein n=1 Tax=Muricoccus radiodurans TaxID=2231721 RepID=UPI003CE9F426
MPARPRRWMAPLLAALAALGLAGPAAAQDYPQRPVRVLVSFPAGGTADILARLVSEGLARRLGQPFIVENRAGAGTVIAGQALTRSAPDGYTLLVTTGTTTSFIPLLHNNPGYTPEQFAGVAMIGRSPLALDVPANSPFRSVQELVAFGVANPNRLNAATQGAGAISHLMAELFRKSTGLGFTPIHYAGSAPGLVATIAGQVDFYFDGVSTSAPAIQGGRLRGLAVTSEQRMPNLPDVPTMRELGYPEVTGYAWYGVHAPAGTPAPIVERLNREINGIIGEREVQDRLLREGAEVAPMSVADFNRLMVEDREKWRDVIVPLNIRMD